MLVMEYLKHQKPFQFRPSIRWRSFTAETSSIRTKKLIHLMSLILEGTSQHQQVSGKTHAIAVNLS